MLCCCILLLTAKVVATRQNFPMLLSASTQSTPLLTAKKFVHAPLAPILILGEKQAGLKKHVTFTFLLGKTSALVQRITHYITSEHQLEPSQVSICALTNQNVTCNFAIYFFSRPKQLKKRYWTNYQHPLWIKSALARFTALLSFYFANFRPWLVFRQILASFRLKIRNTVLNRLAVSTIKKVISNWMRNGSCLPLPRQNSIYKHQ